MTELFEYFQLWDILQDFLLSHKEDGHAWMLTMTGTFSSKSTYHVFF
jgi:hypothetical protein